MPIGLIELSDEVFVEVETEQGSYDISSGVSQVSKGIDQIGPLLKRICRPVVNAWDELNKDIEIDAAEVQVGLSFEGSGNMFLAKAKGGANLQVKLIFSPKKKESESES